MMRVFADDGELPTDARGASVALGNFDGVHAGHQAVIAAARRAGDALGAPTAAAVFEPHPRQLLRPDLPAFRLQSPGQRARALADAGVSILYELAFTPALAALTDEEFVRTQLHDHLGARHVAVGFDFQFGHDRMGDALNLRNAGAALGFGVDIVEPVGGAAGAKISSTAIRAAIGEGRMEEAAALLTRPWAIEGIVGPGAARGRTIGFPTANLGLGVYLPPKFGVYAVTIDVGDGVWRPGVANCGVKPTVGGSAPLLETHIFDFAGDLYGRRIEVRLLHFLRAERKFESFEVLKDQIAADAKEARSRLS